MGGMPHRKRPCAECPWRRDVAVGRFPPERFDALQSTTGGPGAEARIGDPMFACHKSPEGNEDACAGWLAVEGHSHMGVRFAVIKEDLPGAALEPAEGWPALYDSYDEMRERNG